jgi:hypothetical protein
MKRSLVLWIAAVFLTVAAAVFQRVTGPTYPVSGSARLDTLDLSYRFERSHGGTGDARVMLPATDPSLDGVVRWKRLNSDDPWREMPLRREGAFLTAPLPHQPPGGKLEYLVILTRGDSRIELPTGGPVVIRFRGDVPLAVLLPHILAMFAAMLFSTRAGLEAFAVTPAFGGLVRWTLITLFVGGMLLGPLVQWYAFGAFWSGWPAGTDLTDNKTAVAFLGWIAAAIALQRSPHPRRWVAGAAVLLLAVYLIPHSTFGTELDYTSQPQAPHSPP